MRGSQRNLIEAVHWALALERDGHATLPPIRSACASRVPQPQRCPFMGKEEPPASIGSLGCAPAAQRSDSSKFAEGLSGNRNLAHLFAFRARLLSSPELNRPGSAAKSRCPSPSVLVAQTTSRTRAPVACIAPVSGRRQLARRPPAVRRPRADTLPLCAPDRTVATVDPRRQVIEALPGSGFGGCEEQ
jgi:hypothetical protein